MTEPFDAEKLTASEVLGALTGSPEGPAGTGFRISRPCYDKPRRCPGWAGGGTRYARVRRCDSGYINYYLRKDDPDKAKRLWAWRLNQCPKCGVWVLPYVVRWLDWRYVWGWKIADIPGDFGHWWRTNFSWWDEDGRRESWAGPREILARLPEVLSREARYRYRVFKIRHGIGKS